MAGQALGHTLQPTALVHEAWLRLAGNEPSRFAGRAHFFAAAAEAMRHILIDSARRKCAARHGGGQVRVDVQALAEEACFVEAETLARQTLDERLRQSMDPEGNGRTMLILGRVLAQQGKLDEAQHLLQAALPLLCDYIRNTDASAVLAANWLGAIQVARGAYPEAEGLLLPDSHRLFDPANQLSPTEVRLAVGNIIALYEAWRKPEQAAAWKRRLDELANPKANSPR